jgi:hypothetical protein
MLLIRRPSEILSVDSNFFRFGNRVRFGSGVREASAGRCNFFSVFYISNKREMTFGIGNAEIRQAQMSRPGKKYNFIK